MWFCMKRAKRNTFFALLIPLFSAFAISSAAEETQTALPSTDVSPEDELSLMEKAEKGMDTFGEFSKKALTWLEEAGETVASFFKNLLSAFKNAMLNFAGQMNELFSEIKTSVSDTANSGIETINDLFSPVFAFFADVKDAFSSFFGILEKALTFCLDHLLLVIPVLLLLVALIVFLCVRHGIKKKARLHRAMKDSPPDPDLAEENERWKKSKEAIDTAKVEELPADISEESEESWMFDEPEKTEKSEKK